MVVLNAVCETRRAKRRLTAIASRMMTCLRLGRFTSRFGADGTTLMSRAELRPRAAPYAVIIDAGKRVKSPAARWSIEIQWTCLRPSAKADRRASQAGLGL